MTLRRRLGKLEAATGCKEVVIRVVYAGDPDPNAGHYEETTMQGGSGRTIRVLWPAEKIPQPKCGRR